MTNLGGRPTICTPELTEKICSLIEQGYSVRAIGRMEDMPSAAAIFKWAARNEQGFVEQYVKAKEIQADQEFEEMKEIAQTEEDVNRARLIVDTMKWSLSKKLPKKYGDKIDVTTGGDKITSVTVDIVKSDTE